MSFILLLYDDKYIYIPLLNKSFLSLQPAIGLKMIRQKKQNNKKQKRL